MHRLPLAEGRVRPGEPLERGSFIEVPRSDGGLAAQVTPISRLPTRNGNPSRPAEIAPASLPTPVLLHLRARQRDLAHQVRGGDVPHLDLALNLRHLGHGHRLAHQRSGWQR